MKEIWKDIKGYEGLYQVSNLGKVKSIMRLFDNDIYLKIKSMIDKNILQREIGKILNMSQARVSRIYNKQNKYEERILKPDKKKVSGYLRVTLRKNGKTKRFQIHRLVLEAFVGPRPSENHYGMHEDNNPENNIYTNLQWGTSQENSDHRTASGNNIGCKGIDHGLAKIEGRNVLEIIEMYDNGFSQKEISQKFHIHQAQVSRIINNKAWQHIQRKEV